MIRRLTSTRDAVLMLLTLSSGVVDAISFIAFGKVFTAFMTGNLVFLGLGATHAFEHGGPEIPRVCVVLAAFAAGVFLAARMIRRSRATRGSEHAVTVALAGVLVVQVVFLGGWVAAAGDPGDTFATVLAAVEAVAMGMQSSAVGALDVKGVFTTAATATLINLSREAADRRVSDVDPVRMAKILVCLVAGATAGGLLIVHAPSFAAVIPVVATALAVAVRAQRGTPVERTIAGVPLVPVHDANAVTPRRRRAARPS
jgi:uncharacterized membrane protein YoaK (UPF0700 family)